MRLRRSAIALSAIALQLALAAPALADNGEGTAGETNDKVITFFSLGLIVGITLFITVATIIQSRLERRKAARKAARLRGRTGW